MRWMVVLGRPIAVAVEGKRQARGEGRWHDLTQHYNSQHLGKHMHERTYVHLYAPHKGSTHKVIMVNHFQGLCGTAQTTGTSYGCMYVCTVCDSLHIVDSILGRLYDIPSRRQA